MLRDTDRPVEPSGSKYRNSSRLEPTAYSSLAKLAARSSVWSILGQAASSAIGLVSFALLAPLLSPKDYGLVAMASTVTALLSMVGDSGVVSAFVRLRAVDAVSEATAFWVAMAGAAGLFVVGAASTPALAHFYAEAQMIPLGLAMSLMFLIAAPSRVATAKLARALQFRRLALISATANSLGVLVAWLGARQGLGPVSLVFQTAIAHGTQTLLSVLLAPYSAQPRLFSWRLAQELASFSSRLSGFGLAVAVGRVGDTVLVGRVLGGSPVGFYNMCGKLVVSPVQRLCGAVTAVFLPTILRLDHPEQQGTAFAGALRLTNMLIMPIALGVAAIAPEIVALLPAQWAGLEGALRAYAASTVIEPLGWYCISALTALGRPVVLLRLAVAFVPVGWLTALLGTWLGSVAWLAVWTGVANTAFASILLVSVWRALRLERTFWTSLITPLGCSLAMFAAIRLCLFLTGHAARPVGSAIGVAVGAASYTLLTTTFMRKDLDRLRGLLLSFRR